MWQLITDYYVDMYIILIVPNYVLIGEIIVIFNNTQKPLPNANQRKQGLDQKE